MRHKVSNSSLALRGTGSYQLMLLLHLGQVLPTPLVPLLQLGHHCFTFLTQDLLVFNQL